MTSSGQVKSEVISSATPRASARKLIVAYGMGVLSAVLVGALILGTDHFLNSDPPRVYQDFALNADGPVSRADSGQEWSHSNNGAPGANLVVIDGKLTNVASSDSPAAGYVSVDLGEPVTEVGGSFEFAPGQTSNGSATFVIRQVMLPPTPDGPSIVTSPCHLVITPWKLDFGVAKDGNITVVASQTFAEPLAFGKDYGVQVKMDYETGKATVNAPDGNSYVFTDPRISDYKANIISFEVFQQNASTDDRASFHTVSAGA